MKNTVLFLAMLFIFSCDKKSQGVVSKNNSSSTIDSLAVKTDSSDYENINQITSHDTEWMIFNNKNKIPQQVKDFFQASENSELDLANPNESFNATDVIIYPKTPSRQLKLLARKNNVWRMVYIQGGIGQSYHFYEFNIQKDSISDIKKGYSFENISTNDSLEFYIKNGKVKFEKIRIKYE